MDQAKTYKWIQDRLRDLHSGTLSEQDRARLWAMADEDPFVADALEGYQKHPDPSHTEHLDILAQRIILQKRERRRWLIPNLAVTAIAASLIIIVGTWAVINRMDKKEETLFVFVAPDSLGVNDTIGSDLAINEEQPEEAITSSATSTTSNPSAPVTHQPLKANDKTYTREKQKAGDTKSMENVASKKESDKIEIAEPSLTESSEPVEEMADDQPVTAPVSGGNDPATFEDKSFSAVMGVEKSKLDQGYYANQMDPDLMARRVTGRVLDEESWPLIGAFVSVRNTNLGTVTDLNGRFELFLPKPESEIEVLMTGFSPTLTVLRQGEEEVNIILKYGQLAGAITEVAAVRKNTRSKSEKSMASGADLAAISMVDSITFIEYLKANSKFHLRENFYSPGKDVTVEFTVSSNGKTEKVKILSSSGNKSIDEEAMRLIRKGPDWTCDGGVYPCVRRYTFYFK